MQSQLDDPHSLLTHYRRVVRLRLEHAALGGDWLLLEPSHNQVYAYLRHTEDEDIIVILNLSSETVGGCTLSASESPLPAGNYAPVNLLGDQAVASLPVGAGGGFDSYIALPELDTLGGYAILMRGP